ncbi:MAG TPA: phosphotriesterase [Verrucomicrobiae bacterium]|nr:phosphotriesterase [Verrucomicrobiae bacterium]
MKTSRRQFLGTSAWAAAGLTLSAGCASTERAQKRAQIMTVRGPIRPKELGPTLPHEHIFLDFIGADQVSRDRYDAEEVFQIARPHLQLLKDCGGQSLVECTPAYIGRDPLLLRRLSAATELHVLTNTGYYGASQNLYLPRHAWTETADELAARWLTEWRDGIEGTDVYPGFIKIGVDAGKLSDMHRKLVRAAARTHLVSGLTIAAHTGDGTAALDELSVLREEGAAPSAFIWVHAQEEKNTESHLQAAELGAWVEFDHISDQTLEAHVDLVKMMKARGFLNRTLVSHDAGWYQADKPGGGEYRPYDTIFKKFIPALRQEGFSAEETDLLMITNPREAFTIRIRSASGSGAGSRSTAARLGGRANLC